LAVTEIDEQRRDPRLRPETTPPCKITRTSNNQILNFSVYDVSKGGLGLVIVGNILPDTEINLYLGDTKARLEFVWSILLEKKQTPIYHAGFRLLQGPPDLLELFRLAGCDFKEDHE